MNAFFAEVADETPYLEFGRALEAALTRHGVDFDGRGVADVGTGPGLMLKALLQGKTPASVAGFDFSEIALKRARAALPAAKFVRHDIYEPLPNSYDILLCTEVLEHLEHPRRAIETMLRGLTPRGIMILTVPDGRIDFSRYHINFWSAESWRIFLTEAAPGCRITFDRFRANPGAHYENHLAILEPGRDPQGCVTLPTRQE